MSGRKANNVNFITQNRIKPGTRYWAFPVNINKPRGPQLVLTESSLRRMINQNSGWYKNVPIRNINKNEVLFKHPIMRNRNVLANNLRQYIQPYYKVKTPVNSR